MINWSSFEEPKMIDGVSDTGKFCFFIHKDDFPRLQVEYNLRVRLAVKGDVDFWKGPIVNLVFKTFEEAKKSAEELELRLTSKIGKLAAR